MQFLVTGHDGDDAEALARRTAVRPAHLAHADRMREEGTLLFAVSLLDEAERMVGSYMVVDFATRAELDAWLAMEPYVVGNVWKRIDVRRVRVAPSFERPKK